MKRKIKNIIFSFLATTSLMFYLDIRYDFLISCSFFIFIYFFLRTDKEYNKRIKIISIIGAVILSLILSVGCIVKEYLYLTPTIVFNIEILIKTIIMFVGFLFVINRLINLLLDNIDKIKIFDEGRTLDNKKFLLLWLIIFICWIPYFLRFFPAKMSPDSFYVIHYANEGILSDLHTFGHTWFFGAFFHLGKLITSNLNISVAFGTIAQMLLLSLMFATAIKYFYKKGLNKYLCLLMLIFYALFPINAIYSVTLWRDVLFGGSFAIICLYLFEYISNKYQLKLANVIILILTISLMLFFRNNGIYILVLMIPLITLLSKKNKLKTLSVGIIIIIVYFVVKGPIFSYFDVAQTKSIEAYSIPLQQIARVIYLDGDINVEEMEYLNTIMDVEKVKDSYQQLISDSIKNISNGNAISENKLEFLKNWFSILIKNPKVYVESYFFQTIGYWYPSINYGGIGTSTQSFFESDVTSSPITNDTFNNLLDTIASKRIPLCNFIWSIGTYFIMLFISTLVVIYQNKKEYLVVYIPIWCLWGTIMISTPVFAELRYIYGLFTAMPILLCVPFFSRKINKEE